MARRFFGQWCKRSARIARHRSAQSKSREPFHYRDRHRGGQDTHRRPTLASVACVRRTLRRNEADLLRRSSGRRILLAAGSEGLRIEEINPVWLKAPVAPLVGSLMEGWHIDIERILTSFRALKIGLNT